MKGRFPKRTQVPRLAPLVAAATASGGAPVDWPDAGAVTVRDAADAEALAAALLGGGGVRVANFFAADARPAAGGVDLSDDDDGALCFRFGGVFFVPVTLRDGVLANDGNAFFGAPVALAVQTPWPGPGALAAHVVAGDGGPVTDVRVLRPTYDAADDARRAHDARLALPAYLAARRRELSLQRDVKERSRS